MQHELPTLSHDVDVARYIRACPADIMTQGTFFRYLRGAVEKKRGPTDALFAGLARRDWTQFGRYPLRDFMQLAVNAARVMHADVAISEGLRRVGRLAYPSFASTMAGRVVLFAFGDELENMVNAIPKVYALTVPGSHVEVQMVAPAEYRFLYRGVHSFVDTYHLGVLEGAVLEMGFTPRISVLMGQRICDADFGGGWE